MGGDKGKKIKVEEEEENNNNKNNNPQVDEELLPSIEKLQEIQDELEKINEEASDKVLEVEQKYNEIRKPVYNKRNEIIKTIPEFWFTSFISHPQLSMLLTEEDQKIFKYLSSLEVEDSKDLKSGYSIIFNFEPNPYFENTQLKKDFTFHDEGTAEITATPINWKEGKGIVSNGINNEKKGKKRPLAEESFFTWFSSNQTEMIEDMHDEFAEIIKEDLWPNPLSYFSADPDEEESDADEADDGGKDGDGSEEDGDEDDEEDEDDDDDEEDEDAEN